MNMKKLFCGRFNYCGEHREKTVRAYTERQAFYYMLRLMARELGTYPAVLTGFFTARPQAYEISEVKP